MHCCNLLSFSIAIKKKNSFRFLLNFIWKTSPRKRIAPKEVPPSLCIFIAVSVQALYCKHRQERKGNKKAELAMISSTSMHWRELYRVELRQGGQTNKEAVTPQAVSHRLATNAQTRHKFRTFQMRMKLFGLIYSTACPCRTSCNFYTNNVHLWTGTQSYREPLCIQKIIFFSKHGGWEREPVIFLFEIYLPGMVRKRKQEEKTAISAKQLNEPNYGDSDTWHCPSQKNSPNVYTHTYGEINIKYLY